MTIKEEFESTAKIPEISKKSVAELEEERAKVTKRQTEIARAKAWTIHRAPLTKCPASLYINTRKGKLVLPKSYRAEHGEDTKMVWADEDLNRVVYNWYQETVDESNKMGVNFVATDGIVCKRHEYLGPSPHVAGYEIGSEGNIHIQWWDAFLEDQWMDKEKWKIELILNSDGEWVSTYPNF